MKDLLRRAVREVIVLVAIGAIFCAFFILGHLAMYQSWPRWK